jgi:hypothetical protein
VIEARIVANILIPWTSVEIFNRSFREASVNERRISYERRLAQPETGLPSYWKSGSTPSYYAANLRRISACTAGRSLRSARSVS